MTRQVLAASALCLGLSFGVFAQGQAPRAPVSPGQPTAEDMAFRQSALADTAVGLTKPVVIQHVEPKYTSAAMREKLQGQAKVEIVINASGVVDRARVVESLDKVYGLDDEALKAAKLFVFRPGQVAGQAVTVWTTLTMDFRIH